MNRAPTNLALSNNAINENEPIGVAIGTFSTTDPDTGNTFTYSLVTGNGSTDNDLFTLQNNQLKSKTRFDYETKKSYSIRVKTTDQGGLSFEKALTLTINNIADPIVTTPINNVVVNSNAADTILDLSSRFDDPLTTGLVAHFNLADTSAGTIGKDVINVALFDQTGNGAPLTVQNFQSYVNSASYTHSFIHRSIPGFIIQGGGYTFNNSILGTIQSNAPVQNEFSSMRSNLRGTIAMAKLGNNPDSATNQWFFNLANNSSNLDNQNGGFTAFGQVLSADDLATIDAIAAVKTYRANTSTFTDLPLTQPAIADSNFIRFSSITVTQEDELRFSIVGNSQPTLVNPRINNKQLILDYRSNRAGTSDITLRATNLFNEFIDYKFTVTVLPTVSLVVDHSRLVEGQSNRQNVTYTVQLSSPSNQTITVPYTTADGSAIAGSDYTHTAGTLVFTPGTTRQTITIPILNDHLNESDEAFTLKLSSPSNANLGTISTVTTTLTDTLRAAVTTTLPPNVENLTLTGAGAIDGTGNSRNNILIGNNGNNTLTGGAGNDFLTGARGKDTLVGGLGRDRFDYRNLTDSLLNNFDTISDFTATAGKDFFLVSTAPTALIHGGAVTSLNAPDIRSQLTRSTFVAHTAAQFTLGTRTFIAINDALAGFNASTDAVMEVTGFTGTLRLANFTTS